MIRDWFIPKVKELIEMGLLVPFSGRLRAECGLFGVAKMPARLLRVIFDARPANQVLRPLRGSLCFYRLEDMVGAFVHLRKRRGSLHYLNVDYRHYYYQIPLPTHMQRYFVIVLKALQSGINGHTWCPRALPMGYRDACLLAQALTLAIVLYREPEEDDLGIQLDAAAETMPGPVILRWAGRTQWGVILVLLDGVLIMTDTEELRNRWAARLERNERLANVVRKVTHSGELGAAFTCTADRAREGGCDQKCAQEQGIVFGGVKLSPEGVSPTAVADLHMPAKPTWRQVASLLGNSLWRLRVLNAAIHPGRSRMPLLREERFLQLWSIVGSEMGEFAQDGKAWDRPADTLAAAWLTESPDDQDSFLARLRQFTHDGSAVDGPPCDGCWGRASFGVSDAMPGQLGWVEYEWRAGALAATRTRTEAIPHERSQAQCEMLAVRALVLHLNNSLPDEQRGPCCVCGHLPLAIVAVDADAVRFCLRKGYSGDRQYRQALRDMLVSEVWCYRIPGKQNVADLPSRCVLSATEQLDQEADKESKAVLLDGWRALREHYAVK